MRSNLRTYALLAALGAASLANAGTFSIESGNVTHGGTGWPTAGWTINAGNKYTALSQGSTVLGTSDLYVQSQQSEVLTRRSNPTETFALYRSNITISFTIKWVKSGPTDTPPTSLTAAFARRYRLVAALSQGASSFSYTCLARTWGEHAPLADEALATGGTPEIENEVTYPAGGGYQVMSSTLYATATFAVDPLDSNVYRAVVNVPAPTTPVEDHYLQVTGSASSGQLGIGTDCEWQYRLTSIGGVTLQSGF